MLDEKCMKTLGIDATFVGSGGAINHLKNILKNSKSSEISFRTIHVWAPSWVLKLLPDKPHLIKNTNIYLNGPKFIKLIWCIFFMKKNLTAARVDILYVLNGINFSRFKDFVGISQNLLPFVSGQILRFKKKPFFMFKLFLIKYLQIVSYKKSLGFIFLTSFTQEIFEELANKNRSSIVIPHAVNIISNISKKRISSNLSIGYISPIDIYKNHLNVVHAVFLYNQNHLNKISLHIVGGFGSGYKKVINFVKRNKMEKYIFFYGDVPSYQVDKIQSKMNIMIFASSCENFPISILESMALKLPLLCSNIRPMPDILGKHAIYFNPDDIDSIYRAFLICDDKKLLIRNAEESYKTALKYNWEFVADKTFCYLHNIKRNKI